MFYLRRPYSTTIRFAGRGGDLPAGHCFVLGGPIPPQSSSQDGGGSASWALFCLRRPYSTTIWFAGRGRGLAAGNCFVLGGPIPLQSGSQDGGGSASWAQFCLRRPYSITIRFAGRGGLPAGQCFVLGILFHYNPACRTAGGVCQLGTVLS